MRKDEELQNEFCFAANGKQSMNMLKKGVSARIGKFMKIFSYLILFTGLGIVLTSCMGGYITSEPNYVDYARPQRYNTNQIWIDGGWGWNSQTHVYVQKPGYWDNQRQGQSYVPGRWQTTQRGKYWSKGHWQKDSRQNNNRKNNYRRDNDRQNNNRQNNNGNR